MKPSLKSAFVFLIFWTFLVSCSDTKPYALVSISETNGLPRAMEYVTVEIPFPNLEPSKMLVAKYDDTGESILVQVLDTIEKEGSRSLKILFPVRIEANETKTFAFVSNEKMRDGKPFTISLSENNTFVENQIYKANFNTKFDPRGGQIDNLILKDFDGSVLKRGHIPMHWAPNFAKTDVKGYYNMKDLPSDSENRIEKGCYQITKSQSGNTIKVPEINVAGKYTFLADVPYFVFESTMVMEKDVNLSLLRNDEMTMDSLFTHVAYQNIDGNINSLELYTSELDSLESNHISDNTGFVAFYNEIYGYGLASIRIKYDNTNAEGKKSPTRNPHTKISKSQNNGRYWNRVLIDTATTATKGSRYHEKNAYLIFEAKGPFPEEQILYYAERLINPLKVTLMKQD